MSIEINLPEIVAEVSAQFDRYEAALVSNDLETLNSQFWASPNTLRYGMGEILLSYQEISQFRAARSPVGLARTRRNPRITTFGRDFAVANTEFLRDSAPGKVGRQSQTWVRLPEGWRIVSAHVSLINDPAAS